MKNDGITIRAKVFHEDDGFGWWSDEQVFLDRETLISIKEALVDLDEDGQDTSTADIRSQQP